MKKMTLISTFVLLLLSCSKEEEAPTPTNNTVTTVNYLLNLQYVGDIVTYHKFYLNGVEKSGVSFNVKTNDLLTGHSYTVASTGKTIGVIVSLEGNEAYNNQSYKMQNDTLFHYFVIP